MPVLTEEKKHGGVIAPPREPTGFGNGDGDDAAGGSFPVSKARVAMWVVLTAVTMLFAGLTSAYIVLRGVPGWQHVPLPPLLWVNTLTLIASSVTLEIARRSVLGNRQQAVKLWLGSSGVLGLGFLAGQVAAWRELVRAGVYLPSTLHSSFLYVLTGVHGVHLLGGVIGLTYVLWLAYQHRLTPVRHEPLRLCSLYWHFMDAVWIYIFVLLVLG